MITEDKVIEIFYMADEYSREFSKVRQKYSLDEGRNDGKRRRNKPNRMSDAEIMVILILFHTGGFRCFKHFYLEYVSRHMRHLFPVLSSYSRFVELEKEVALCLALFIKDVLLGKCTGISFTDSTALRVCHIKRMHSHRTFSGLAQKGKTTMGWFYGFKLHLIINDRGEILNFMITPGNTDDREPLRNERYVQDIRGKLCGDRGYIGKALFEMLFINGTKDKLFPIDGVKDAFDIMHGVWRSQGADDKLVTEIWEVPHSCGKGIQAKALEFLDNALKGKTK